MAVSVIPGLGGLGWVGAWVLWLGEVCCCCCVWAAAAALATGTGIRGVLHL